MKKPEILAPVGSWAMLNTAINAGVDSVYFGIKGFNMRASAKNFELDELAKVVELCHKNKVKTFLTVNIIVYENEIKDIEKLIKHAKKYKVDAIICWDFSVIQLCKKHGIPFHISTQASVSNSEAANFYHELGAERIVLARESSLEQIKKITASTKAEIEIFVHGAMCVSVSGRCFTSQFLYNKSANRGECIQPCRREYIIKDKEEGYKLELENNYVMSAKDLCSIEFIDKIIETGAAALKIEGRAKQPEYVKTVIESYKQAIDAYYNKDLTDELKTELKKKLESVYNRGFSTGFYFNKPTEKDFATEYGSVATSKKVFIGPVLNYYKKVNVAEVKILSNELKKGVKIIIIGNKTGCVETTVESIQKNKNELDKATKGDVVGIKIDQLVRENDKVYLVNNIKEKE